MNKNQKKTFAGKPPTAGRPKGVLNKRTIAAMNIQITALREGLTPVDVMLKVMYENLDAANRITIKEKEFDEHLAPVDLKGLPDGQERRELEHKQRNLARKIKMRRDHLAEAAANASDVAPYIHPKLIANKHSNDPDNPMPDGEGSFDKIADALNKLADQKVINGNK